MPLRCYYVLCIALMLLPVYFFLLYYYFIGEHQLWKPAPKRTGDGFVCRPPEAINKTSIDWIEQLEIDYDDDDESLVVYRSKSLREKGLLFIDEQTHDGCKLVRGRRVVVTFSTHSQYTYLAVRSCKRALDLGVDICLLFGPNFLDSTFKEQHDEILRSKRGGGFWLWKPYILLRLLLVMDHDDVLIYLDADKVLVNSVEEHICLQASLNQDVVLFPTFGLRVPEFLFSKADAFFLIGVEDIPLVNETAQVYGAYMLLRKSLYSIRFVSEWLVYCQDDRVNTDEHSKIRQDKEYPYTRHTFTLHDQTALSLLAKKWHIPTWGNPELCWKCKVPDEHQYPFSFPDFNNLQDTQNLTTPSNHIICTERDYGPEDVSTTGYLVVEFVIYAGIYLFYNYYRAAWIWLRRFL